MCSRCFTSRAIGRHGVGRCPLEPRRWGETVESDRFKFAREQIVALMAPGTTGVRTRGQYQQFLKSRGMTDDLTAKEIQDEALRGTRLARHRDASITRFITSLEPAMHQRDARWVQQHGRV